MLIYKTLILLLVLAGAVCATDKLVIKNNKTYNYGLRGGPCSTYDDLIIDAAKKHNVDPALVKAVMQAESNFNPLDRSLKGACGLMQLMPATARLLGVRNIYNPQENVYAGARYLRAMLDIFNGNIEKALAAYNAGPATVQKYSSVPPYRETREYVRKVKTYLSRYGKNGKVIDYTDENGILTLYNVK
jgi:soluble lytic murein transglycosylase-like protein